MGVSNNMFESVLFSEFFEDKGAYNTLNSASGVISSIFLFVTIKNRWSTILYDYGNQQESQFIILSLLKQETSRKFPSLPLIIYYHKHTTYQTDQRTYCLTEVSLPIHFLFANIIWKSFMSVLANQSMPIHYVYNLGIAHLSSQSSIKHSCVSLFPISGKS